MKLNSLLKHLLPIWISGVLFFEPLRAELQDVKTENESYSVSLLAEVEGYNFNTASEIVPMTVIDKKKNSENKFSVNIPRRIVCRKVKPDGSHSPAIYQDRLVIETGTHCDEILVVNVKTGQTQDTIWALRGIALSKSKRFMAYVEHTPRRDYGKPYREVLLVYDLDRSALENRLDPQYASDPMYSGIPVFPEENVEQESYDYAVESREKESSIASPLLWLDDDGLVFVEWWRHPGVNYLIRIDLNKALRQPEITRRRIEPCLSDDITGSIRLDGQKSVLYIDNVQEEAGILFLHVLSNVIGRLEGVKGEVIRVSMDVFDKPACNSDTN